MADRCTRCAALDSELVRLRLRVVELEAQIADRRRYHAAYMRQWRKRK